MHGPRSATVSRWEEKCVRMEKQTCNDLQRGSLPSTARSHSSAYSESGVMPRARDDRSRSGSFRTPSEVRDSCGNVVVCKMIDEAEGRKSRRLLFPERSLNDDFFYCFQVEHEVMTWMLHARKVPHAISVLHIYLHPTQVGG